MDDSLPKTKSQDIKKKSKTGPLKSSPGFLKCMRSVYLYFKEEKEKGALNIPINSFIERTAVACGVGRKTLYNYAKKGLFDEHPALLQPKKRKKCSKRASNDGDDERDPARGSSDSPASPTASSKRKRSRNAQIQTDVPISQPQTAVICSSIAAVDNGLGGYLNPTDAKMKAETTNVQTVTLSQTIPGPWAGGNSARRDIDYFTKTNIWQNVYSINTSDTSTSGAELTPTRMGNCQPTTTAIPDL